VSIILCGLPGCGKTTIGKLLAEKLLLDFIDTDRLVEEACGGTCREIYSTEGESYFRSLEKKCLHNLSGDAPSVIAIGGGALLDEANTIHLKSLGKIVYLKGAPAFLFERAVETGIPAYLDHTNPWIGFKELAESRDHIYKKAADYSIDIQKKSTEQILQMLGGQHHGE